MSGRAIVLGGAGQLGKSVISRFIRSGWKTMSVDHFHNEESTGSIEIPEGTLDVVIHEWSSNYTTHTQKTVNGKDWIEKTKNITIII